MAQCCRVRRCTLTDVVPATLENLHDNVRKLPPTAAPCRVASLDWCAPRAFLGAEERAPELILGADLVYEPTLAAPLAAPKWRSRRQSSLRHPRHRGRARCATRGAEAVITAPLAAPISGEPV